MKSENSDKVVVDAQVHAPVHRATHDGKMDGPPPNAEVSDIALVARFGTYSLYTAMSRDDRCGLMWVSDGLDEDGKRTIRVDWHPEPAGSKPNTLVSYQIEQLDLGPRIELMFRPELDEIVTGLFLQLADAADDLGADKALAAAIKHANALRRYTSFGDLALLIAALKDMDVGSLGIDEAVVERLVALEEAMLTEESRLSSILDDGANAFQESDIG